MNKTKNALLVILLFTNILLIYLLIFGDYRKKITNETSFQKPTELSKTKQLLDTLKANPDVILSTDDLRLIMPKEDTILINCQGCFIPVRNFYKNASFITKDSTCEFFSCEDFSFHYDHPYNIFHIYITSENILKSVHNAERKFLDILKIDEFQACMMNVSIGIDKGFQDYSRGTPYYLNNYSTLSFCGD